MIALWINKRYIEHQVISLAPFSKSNKFLIVILHAPSEASLQVDLDTLLLHKRVMEMSNF